VREADVVTHIGEDGVREFAVTTLETFAGLRTERFQELSAGHIALLSGVESPKIGDTICQRGHTDPLPGCGWTPPPYP